MEQEQVEQMRIRTIKPEFFRDGTITKLSPLARLLFIGLWCCADRSGRLEDRPDDLQLTLLPAERDIVIDALLSLLAEARLIIRYAVNGGRYIQVVNFEKHQRITGKELEQELKYPDPPQVLPWDVPGTTQVSPECVKESQERKGKERNGVIPIAHSPSANGPVASLKKAMADAWGGLFVAFWAKYPRKVAKAAGRRAWMKHTPRSPDLLAPTAAAVAAVLAARIERDWKGRTLDTLPYPATFLNGEEFHVDAK